MYTLTIIGSISEISQNSYAYENGIHVCAHDMLCLHKEHQQGVNLPHTTLNQHYQKLCKRTQWLFKQLTVILHQNGYLDERYIRNINNDLYKKTYSEIYCTQMIGSSSGWGSRHQRTADRMDRCVQQSWTESKFGEDRGKWVLSNLDGKTKQINMDGEKLKQRDSCLPGWSDMWGWQFASLNKEKRLWYVAWTLASVFR